MKTGRLMAFSVMVLTMAAGISAQLAAKGGSASITPDALREWLTYMSSDDLEGRATFSEGLGLVAAYIQEQSKESGVKPGGDHGTSFYRVNVLGIKSTNHSTLTLE